MAFRGNTILFDFDRSIKFKEKKELKEIVTQNDGQIALNLNKKVGHIYQIGSLAISN